MPSRSLRPRRGPRAEVALAPEIFRQMVETLPHMAWSARPEGTVEFLNQRVLEYTGCTHEQLEDWGWRLMVHPEDLERCVERWTRAFTKGHPYEVEYRLRRHDGAYLWHLGAAMPLRKSGRIVRWVGTCTEIESQKRAERLLEKARASLEGMVALRAAAEAEVRSQKERLRLFMDTVPAIAWIKDSKLRYSWVSASYARIRGKPVDTVVGRDDFALWPRGMAERFRANDEKALRVKGPVQDVATMPFSDGNVGRWLAVKFPLPDESGALGVAGLAFDIGAEEIEGVAQDDSPLARLSGREYQVLHLLVEGCTSAEMAERLSLSPKSVDTYRSRVMTKLGIDDLPSLVKFALRHGLTTRR